ncbi:TonB-dependent receptor [Parabacteroides sp. PF5-6]|uniref:TonB-dependent receptor n=1 Tax=Parabacteroides sp. PF5-6 TaxID=1742403 RepID=UPI002404D34D|nr:TonB-dependent receptor [Parabacteroides sp. PF5-6]
MTMGVQAQSIEQPITIQVNKVNLREFFKEVEKQSTFTFVYRDIILDEKQDITLDVSQKSLESVLTQVLNPKGLAFRVSNKTIVIIQQENRGSRDANRQTAPASTISGTINDAVGEPMIGATVQLKGTTTGTIADYDGHFSLAGIRIGDILEVSYIGYNAQEIVVKDDKPLAIVLKEDVQFLDEVVVVGYGVQKKSDITGAVASLSSEMLEERPQTNIIQSLQGAIAGLNISITGSNAEGSSSTTTIRGTNSITASNNPLIIMDGIPFEGPWSEINSNDVQSIEVLKDASSAAIYGARGSNGVILITTKKGDAGKLSVSYNAFFTSTKPTNLPRMMNGEEYWKYKLEALEEANTTTPTESNPQPWLANMTDTEVRMHNAGIYTDWIDVITRDAFSQQHNLSFRGGANKTKYYISLNYINAEGISLNDQYERYNFRINLEQEFFSWLKYSSNTQLGRYDRSGKSPDFGRAFLMIPLAEPYNEDGSVKLKAWEHSSEAFNRNPLSNIKEKNSDVRYKVITNNALDVSIPWVKGLTYRLNTGFTLETSSYKNYRGRDTYQGEGSNGELNLDEWTSTDWIIENIVNYANQFGKHSIFFTGLYSTQSKVYEQTTVSGKDFPNDVMSYYQVAKAGTLSGTGSYWKQNHISQMARLNYSYDSKYLITLTARRDGYSAFGEDSKFGVFPSLALGWNLSNEGFFMNSKVSDVVSSLKLRTSYGMNGNEAVSGAYVTLPSLNTFNYLTEDHKPMYGFYPVQLASPNLGWETTTSFNVGVDFGILEGRIQGTYDMYWSNTKDLLLQRTIPTINGTNVLLDNVGETSNRGWELQLSSTNILKKNFKWNTTLNLVHYNSKIKNVGLFDEDGKPIDDVASGWFIGESVGANYDYVFDGIWQITDPANPKSAQDPNYPSSIPGYMKYKDLDGEVGITTADKAIIGKSIPDITIGMMNMFTYRDFTLSFFLNSQFGRTARNYLRDVNGNSYAQNKMMIEFWTPDNPINTYPKNQLNNGVNPEGAGFYEKTDFIRLQDVTLSYKLPKTLMTKAGIERLEVYTNLKNLYTWTTWTGLDPEYISSQRAAPQTRSVVVGVKFDF